MPIYRLPKIIAREAAGTQAPMLSKCWPSKMASSAPHIWVLDSSHQSQRPQPMPGVRFFPSFPALPSTSLLLLELRPLREPRPYQMPPFAASIDIGHTIKISSNASPNKRPETGSQRRNGRRLLLRNSVRRCITRFGRNVFSSPAVPTIPKSIRPAFCRNGRGIGPIDLPPPSDYRFY